MTSVRSADGTTVACTVTGNGPAVVLVDGALCHRRARRDHRAGARRRRRCQPELLRASARAVAAAVPGGEYRTLPGQTHDVAAEVLAPVLLEFFAS